MMGARPGELMGRALESIVRVGVTLGLAGLGCEGTIPFHQGNPDASSNPPDTGQTLSGMTVDFRTQAGLATVSLSTQGIDPAMTTTRDGSGTFALSNVPDGSKLFLVGTRANYAQTWSEPVSIG